MPWFENLLVSARTLWANRLRSGLTMLGLVIGIGSVILMLALGAGAQNFVKDQFRSLGTNVVVVGEDRPARGGRPFTMADVAALGRVSAVQETAPFMAADGRVVWKSHNASGRIYGITPALVRMLGFPVLKGRFFSEQEVVERAPVVVIGQEVSKELFGAEEPVGKQVLINSQTLTVIGVTKQVAFRGFLQFVDRGLMMPLPFVHERLLPSETPFGKRVDLAFLATKPGETIQTVTFQVTNLLRQRHQNTDTDDFFVGNTQDQLDIFNNITLGFSIVLGLTAAISLIVGGINIMNIMLVSVTERTREIGLRKALGASQGAILMQFVVEAVLLSWLGGLMGVLVGVGLANLIGAFSPLKPEVTPWSIALAAGVSGAIGVFFGVFPAQRAARLDPIIALRAD
ncbi:ABC transporter permease [Anthocerotibacter panamensis]|uniref:ABC transporter permease n=1 Tax=Anthocerotibacter panamensis TaxID=2857077 RepID=UPI001C404750|nr:ABC transporter permease [Anthocerotibacter panamensis]